MLWSMTPARSAGGWGFVTVMVVDIAVRAKLYGSTQCYDRSIADETEDDETGKVSCGKPWQLYCILVGITDVLFRSRSRQPMFPPVCISVMRISALGMRRGNWRDSRPTFSTNDVLA
jgi:hypothetical protein